MVRCLRPRVPAITAPLNTMTTSRLRSSAAYRMLWNRFSLASVKESPMGFWEPVSTMGLGLSWMR